MESESNSKMVLTQLTKSESVNTKDIVEIPISDIEGLGLRLVSSIKDMKDLSESLLLHGQLSPILLRPKEENSRKYEIVYGNRRFDAAKKLGWTSIKAQIAKVTKSEALVLAFTENSDREDFTDYEKALLLQKMHEASGKKYKELAKLVGRSPAFVAQHVAMIHLFSNEIAPEDERFRVLSSLTEAHARVLARIEDPVDRWNTARLATASGMGVRELARMCSRKGPDSMTTTMEGKKSVVELIRDILRGTSGRDIRPFSESVCSKHYTMFTSFGNSGRLGYEQALDHFTNTIKKVGFWDQRIEDLEIRTVGNMSYATLIVNHQMKIRKKTFKPRVRATLIFEKENGFWKCTHGHWSSVDKSEQIPLYLNQSLMQESAKDQF